MSTITKVLLEPVLAGLGSGTADWPTVGVLLAWFLVAALVGTMLGSLRDAVGNARVGGRTRPVRAQPKPVCAPWRPVLSRRRMRLTAAH